MVLSLISKKVQEKETAVRNVKAVIEIQSGSREKKVYDSASNSLKLHRILPSPLPENVHYGFIPKTLSEDGDALDIFVISARRLETCKEYDVKPLRLMKTHDDQGPDDKVIALDIMEKGHLGSYKWNDKIGRIYAELLEFVAHAKDNEPNRWVNVIGFEDVEAANDKILESYLRKQ